MGPTISTIFALLKSAENAKETNIRLVVVLLFAEPRDTCKLKFESESEPEIAANAPSFVSLTTRVWANSPIGSNTSAAITANFFMVSLLSVGFVAFWAKLGPEKRSYQASKRHVWDGDSLSTGLKLQQYYEAKRARREMT
jgi:hypothetical protein